MTEDGVDSSAWPVDIDPESFSGGISRADVTVLLGTSLRGTHLLGTGLPSAESSNAGLLGQGVTDVFVGDG